MVFYWGLLKCSTCTVFRCNKQPAFNPGWSNIHDIMPKLRLNPNYKQVLGEFSRQVSTANSRSLSARGFLSSSEILRALFCTLVEWHGVINLYILKKTTSWSRLKRAHYASKPFDLLEIIITFLLQLRKFW